METEFYYFNDVLRNISNRKNIDLNSLTYNKKRDTENNACFLFAVSSDDILLANVVYNRSGDGKYDLQYV
jgi:hypothetical protein